MVELGRITLRLGSPALQDTLLHVASNSLHFHLVNSAVANARGRLRQQLCRWRCTACMEPGSAPPVRAELTPLHLLSCPQPTATRFRSKLHLAVVQLLSEPNYPDTLAWLRDNGGAGGDLSALLHALFQPPPAATAASAEDSTRQPALCLVGAFSKSEASWAVRRLKLPDRADGLALLHQLRLLCLRHIRRFYNLLKKRLR